MRFALIHMMRALLFLIAIALFTLPAMADAACADETLRLGFYAFFDPISYSADSDLEADEFNTHLGYEADLTSALEAMEGAGLAFERRGIGVWDEIWLRAAGDDFDVISGGITILDSRTFDAEGVERIRFTSGHITFRQSLLVRAEDAAALDSHDKLHSGVRVGALAGTTGEKRLLQLTGYVDEAGVLLAGARIETADGELIADGSADYVITAGGESPGLSERLSLHPPVESMPQVIYFRDEAGDPGMEAALAAGEVDALARGAIGNQAAAHASDGAFVVTALDEAIENGGFALDVADEALAACLNDKIDWLTDERRISVAEWLENPLVFMERAAIWNARDDAGSGA